MCPNSMRCTLYQPFPSLGSPLPFFCAGRPPCPLPNPLWTQTVNSYYLMLPPITSHLLVPVDRPDQLMKYASCQSKYNIPPSPRASVVGPGCRPAASRRARSPPRRGQRGGCPNAPRRAVARRAKADPPVHHLKSPLSRRPINTNRQQQGLMRLFHDFCVNDKYVCHHC